MVGGNDTWLIIDDTSLPKKGTHSVGVAPQYASIWQERQPQDAGVADAGLARGSGNGGASAVPARGLEQRHSQA